MSEMDGAFRQRLRATLQELASAPAPRRRWTPVLAVAAVAVIAAATIAATILVFAPRSVEVRVTCLASTVLVSDRYETRDAEGADLDSSTAAAACEKLWASGELVEPPRGDVEAGGEEGAESGPQGQAAVPAAAAPALSVCEIGPALIAVVPGPESECSRLDPALLEVR